MSKKIVVGVVIYSILGLFAIRDVWPWSWKEKSRAEESQKETLTETLPVKQAPPAQTPAAKSAKSQQLEQEKNILVANINAMRNQELTVNVLQQLLNREITELRRMQAVFCDQYGLNPDKWRQGLYEYDAQSGRFIEKTK